MKKTKQLRNIFNENSLNFFLESHNALSAKITEEAGFKGIWASGLGMSAALGVRDNNEASWTQILEVLEFMSDATSIPILVDGDTGHGNFNNFRRFVAKLEQREIAGVCIEDKIFPKKNSFIKGEQQSLASIEEFCGKIMAGKDSQQDSDFCIVARTESFIVGQGLETALERCYAYAQAGADAVLVHSKSSTVDEISSFMRSWDHVCPVVIVPTTYYRTPTSVFSDLGISLVLWANHMVRASVLQMQKVAKILQEQKTILSIDDLITPLQEIFRLQGEEEMRLAEEKYLPPLSCRNIFNHQEMPPHKVFMEGCNG